MQVGFEVGSCRLRDAPVPRGLFACRQRVRTFHEGARPLRGGTRSFRGGPKFCGCVRLFQGWARFCPGRIRSLRCCAQASSRLSEVFPRLNPVFPVRPDIFAAPPDFRRMFLRSGIPNLHYTSMRSICSPRLSTAPNLRVRSSLGAASQRTQDACGPRKAIPRWRRGVLLRLCRNPQGIPQLSLDRAVARALGVYCLMRQYFGPPD